MRALRRFVRRLTAWARTGRDEERLQAEIAEHIALQTADNLRAGMSPAEARRQAMIRFGAVEAIKEEYRDQRSLPFMETLLQDSRHAVRGFWRRSDHCWRRRHCLCGGIRRRNGRQLGPQHLPQVQ